MNDPSDRYYQYGRAEMAAYVPERCARTLEVGCATGRFREHVRGAQEYWGVEPVEDAAMQARTRLDRVLVGEYADVHDEIPRAHFDLVICNDVIEHIVDHEAFLRSVAEKMTRGGTLLASIPNVRFVGNLYGLLAKRDWRYTESGVLDRTHVRFFTERSVRRLIRDCGLVLDRLEGIHAYRSRSRARRLAASACTWVMGRDVRFRQFAVRALKP